MTEQASTDHIDEVRYPLPQFKQQAGRARTITIVAIVVMIAGSAWTLARGGIPLFPIGFLIFALYTQWKIRRRGRDAVATHEGIFGPHLRHPILWSDVAYLQEPLRYDMSIDVELSSGERKATGFPPSFFPQLQALAPVPTRPKDPLH